MRREEAMKRIAIIGFGFIGKAHLQAYKHIKNAEVTTICTRSNITNQEISEHYEIVSDFSEVLSNDEIDIVDICLPTYLHEQSIIQAAKAGKQIICEKPLTLSPESAEKIFAAVEKNQVQLFVGHVLRFWPEYKLVKDYCDNGKLKDIEILHAKRLGQFPQWSDWFKYNEKSGGALFDLHIHDIDYATYLLGEVDSVYAVGTKNQYGTWDHLMTTLSFKNNAKAFVEASHRMPIGFPFTMALRVQAKQGMIEFHSASGENIENRQNSKNGISYYTDQNITSIPVENEDAFQNELSYFLNCIEKNTNNEVIPLADVFYTLKLLKAIEKSLISGEVIKLK